MQKRFNTHLDPRDRIKQNWDFKQPKMIGYFSVNEHREFIPDASKLKYLKMPRTQNVHLDLNEGIKEFRPKPESVTMERMDFLLRYILNNFQTLKFKNGYNRKLLEADIICSRGRLAQIMCTNPKSSNKWSLLVSKYKGNIYICQPDGDDLHTIQTAYGFKLEQYLMTGTFYSYKTSLEGLTSMYTLYFKTVS